MTEPIAIRTLPVRSRDAASRPRSIAIAGGKGGVGKSTIAVNLAVGCAQAGAKALLVDTNLGMADLNLLLGIAPGKTWLDALGGTPIENILVQVHGIELLPALNGSYFLATLGATVLRRMRKLIEVLATSFDTVVLDVAAGIGASQTLFASATKDVVVVANPEPLSIAGAYACLKAQATEQNLRHAFVIPNRTSSQVEADEVAAQLTGLVTRFLNLELTVLPPIPPDPSMVEAAHIGVPLLLHSPNAPAARAIRQIVEVLGVARNTNGTPSRRRDDGM